MAIYIPSQVGGCEDHSSFGIQIIRLLLGCDNLHPTSQEKVAILSTSKEFNSTLPQGGSGRKGHSVTVIKHIILKCICKHKTIRHLRMHAGMYFD